MNNSDQFVDAVYDELESLFEKDKNIQKDLLGNQPIRRIFDIYSDWLANNLALSPRVAANAIYKDVRRVNYKDFQNRTLKRGVQLKGEPSFNLIYGNQAEIDQAVKVLTQVRNQSEDRYNLIVAALQKVKGLSDTVKPEKNIFGGKTTNVAKQQANLLKMPRLGTIETFMKMNDQQLKKYIQQLDKTLGV